MTTNGWIQFVLFSAVLLALTEPIGLYLVHVLERGRTWFDPVFRPVERLLYRLLGTDPERDHTWTQYAFAMLMFSLVTLVVTYGILRLQMHLPLQGSPEQLSTAMTPDLAFNTAASFTTNTNWQSYSGEDTITYFSQMVGLASHNFMSAAVGIAIAAALVRGIARDRSRGIGNFWVDLVRLHLYLLVPVCIVYALFLVSQGMIQNFSPYTVLKTVEGADQIIPQGPMASQVAVKMLGTNGGGYVNANAAFPFENPTPLSNFVQMLSIFAIPAGLTYYLGRMVKKQSHGWAVWAAMFVLFFAGFSVAYAAEAHGNLQMHAMGVDATGGNMEGKETRFGIMNSTLFATITTDASCGAVNAMHDSFTPVGGLVPLFNLHLGEVVFGGVGAGLYGMLLFVVLAIFIAGLMIGRTPEYLGKRIEGYDVKVTTLAVLVTGIFVLGFSAMASVAEWGTRTLNNGGPHGFSEILYAYSSGVANNGSAFAGLGANNPWWNTTLGLAMLFGRFFIIIPVLALAGSLAGKKLIPPSAGSFPVSGATFTFLLTGTVVIVGALTFIPSLALGPIVEHFLMNGGKTF
jgi:potassium-transporting ATPase potassium-binding subunit